MDGGILVVSATDGPMPQTREHILLSRQVLWQCRLWGALVVFDSPLLIFIKSSERSVFLL
jgi:hypothetical protein